MDLPYPPVNLAHDAATVLGRSARSHPLPTNTWQLSRYCSLDDCCRPLWASKGACKSERRGKEKITAFDMGRLGTL
jgi:hypothetical protein